MPGSWPGFSFALRLLRVQGFYFALLQYNPIQAFTTRFVLLMQLYHTRHKTANRALQGHFLRLHQLNSQQYQTSTSGYNIACATLERITAPQRLQHIPDTNATPGRCTGQHSRPIIIRYIKRRSGAPVMDPRHPGGVSILPTPGGLQSGAGSVWPLHPAGQSSGRGVAGGAEPLAATAVSLFGLSPDS